MNKITKKFFLIVGVIIVGWLLFYDVYSGKPYENKPEKGFIFQHYSDTPECLMSDTLSLNKGTYTWVFKYSTSEEGNEIIFTKDDIELHREILPIDMDGEYTYDMVLEENVPKMNVKAYYGGSGYFQLVEYIITPGQKWYYDNWLKLFGFIVVVTFLFYVKKKSEIPDKGKDAVELLMVFIIAASCSIAFLRENQILSGNDLNFHLTRIEGLATAIQNGLFPARIYPNLVKQNGYLGTLYPDLFMYIPALLRVLGMSIYATYKFSLILINFATAFSMYYSCKSMSMTRKARILATLFYVFANYRLHDIFVRAAFGEVLALIFFPLIIAGLYHTLVGDRKKWWILVIGATGVFQSHIVSTLIWVPIILAIVIIFHDTIIRERRIKELIKVVISILLINLFYLVPFVIMYMKNDLNLSVLFTRNIKETQRNISYIFEIIPSSDTDSSNASLRFPLVFLCGISFIRMVFDKSENIRQRFMNVLTVTALIILLISSSWFPYEKFENIPLLHNVFDSMQYLFRITGPAVVMIIISGASTITEWKLLERYHVALISTFTIFIMVDTAIWGGVWPSDAHPKKPFYVADDSIDVAHINNKIKSDYIVALPEYYIVGDGEFNTTYELSNSNTNVINYSKNKLSIDMTYQISSENDEYVVLPLMRYYGYEVTDENGELIETHNSHSGTFEIPLVADGKTHIIHIMYKEPKVFILAGIVSLVFLISNLSYEIIEYFISRRRSRVNSVT